MGADDLAAWFRDAFAGITRVRAAAAASVLTIDHHSVLRLIKLALRSGVGDQTEDTNCEETARIIWDAIERSGYFTTQV